MTNDPYPWVTIDPDTGEVFRTHTVHEDDVDRYGNLWSGWQYRPRTGEQLRLVGGGDNA